jgi:glycine/serine hydroxymethyltransferase
MGVEEMRRIGGWILQVLKSPDDEGLQHRIRRDVSELCRHFPVPGAEAEGKARS